MAQERKTIDEITVQLKRRSFGFDKPIRVTSDVAELARKIMRIEELEVREKFVVLYLDRANKIIGYFMAGVGGVNAVIVDGKMILGIALKCLATSIILVHNHPSGVLKPSVQDRNFTAKLKQAAVYHDIILLDHFIITPNGYYSFSDQNLMGLNGITFTGDEATEAQGGNPVELIDEPDDTALDGLQAATIKTLQLELQDYLNKNSEL